MNVSCSRLWKLGYSGSGSCSVACAHFQSIFSGQDIPSITPTPILPCNPMRNGFRRRSRQTASAIVAGCHVSELTTDRGYPIRYICIHFRPSSPYSIHQRRSVFVGEFRHDPCPRLQEGGFNARLVVGKTCAGNRNRDRVVIPAQIAERKASGGNTGRMLIFVIGQLGVPD